MVKQTKLLLDKCHVLWFCRIWSGSDLVLVLVLVMVLAGVQYNSWFILDICLCISPDQVLAPVLCVGPCSGVCLHLSLGIDWQC